MGMFMKDWLAAYDKDQSVASMIESARITLTNGQKVKPRRGRGTMKVTCRIASSKETSPFVRRGLW